ncbi:MAG: DUF4294 domain-containing protein [Flavobacteriia bacterium]
MSVLFSSKGQVKDTSKIKIQYLEEIKIDKDFEKKYRQSLRRIRKVYPLALYAAKKIKEMDAEIEQAESKRKKKKVAKEENKQLKDDFYFVIRDMYIEEGKLLMKLIHRETGMTVRQIIKKYRSGFKAELNDNLGKLWEQDLDATYDPKGDDWIIEKVIQDIKNEKVIIDFTPKILTKEEYKASKKEYKINKKEAKKAMRKQRKSGS